MPKFLNIRKLKYYLEIKNYKIENYRSGFTLIELLVVVALAAVLTTVGLVYLGSYRTEQNLKLTASELLVAVQNAQRLSMSQQDGKKWGVHFVNTTSSAGQSYSIFSGTSFAGGTVSRTYPVGRNISFSNPWASSTLDTIFNAVTGYPSQPQVISLVDGRGDGMVNDIIMNSRGQITSKFDTGLVGYWHFDEGTGATAYDATGSGNNGTLTNSPTWQSSSNCKVGSCLQFYSAVSAVNVLAPAVSPQTTLTLSAWIKPVSYPSERSTIILGSGGYYLSLYTDGSVQTYWYGKTPPGYFSSGAGTVPLNSWSFVAAVWNSSSVSLYVNGMLENTTSTSGVGNGSTATNIGAENTSRQFSGFIDEVRVYNRALSATEIQDIYNSTR